MRKYLSCMMIVVFRFSILPLQAGDWDVGATVGLTVYLGNKTDRAGVFVGAWVRYDFVQLNSGLRVYYNFKNLGPPDKYWEFDGYGGLLAGWGKRDSVDNPFITNVSNQTGRRYAFAYSYNFYCDGIETSQRTGSFAIQLNKITVITENDLFGDNKDRFRTAAATVQYRQESTIIGLSVILWSGATGDKVLDSTYPSRRGYKKPGRFGQYSHGILCMQVRQDLGCGQNVQAGAGIDAEQVRNAFQNKFIHDLAFLPANWVKRSTSASIPMLDTNNEMYLYQPGQKIRKPTPYFNLAANPSLFY